MRKAKITLNKSTLLQGGVKCANPTITVTGTEESCLLVNCIEDAAGKYEIIVQIPDDCDEQCITYIIDCDDCDQCPPQTYTRCLCDDSGDCPNCLDCVEGFCQPIDCPDICNPANGDCVECIVNGDCPCDQVCVNGACGCPVGFLENSKGCCVECLDNDDCEGCDICTGGTCTTKTCASILNPVTCDCVECVENDDCGVNECCIGGNCGCCPGFYRDPLGDCVEIPDCTTAEDCPTCFTCVAGDCVPITCPDGRICVNGDCVTACDCDNPFCAQGSVCIPDFKGDCYCSPCTGTCETNADCGEGCQCEEGSCKPKPCVGPCEIGADCGDGCGCQNGECVDCSTLTCAQCENVSGCDCIGGVCEDSPCDTACISGDDCGPGCGCQNNDCVSCASVSCSTNANCPEGCVCVDGTCTPNPCLNVTCSNPGDCGQGCGCQDGLCVPCSTLPCNTPQCDSTPGCECVSGTCQDDNDDDCNDTISLTKVDAGCDLIAEQTTDDCCQCENIENRIATTYTIADAVATYAVKVDLYKGGVLLSASPNGADDLPVSGVYQATLEQTFREVYPTGNPLAGQAVPGGLVQNLTTNKSLSVAGLATITINFSNTDVTLPAPNTTVIIGGTSYRIASRRIKLRTTTNVAPNNACRYSLSETQILSVASFNPGPSTGTVTNFNTMMNRLVNCRQPKWFIYKGDTAAELADSGNIVETYYPVEVSPGVYRETYTGFEPLEYGKYYRLESDCGCEKVVDYSCYNPGGPATPLVFCHPTPPLVYTISECGKTITFTEDVVVNCDVYTAVGAAKPVYQVVINGNIAATITLGSAPSTGNVLIPDTTEYTVADCITSVELRQVADVCDTCTIRDSLTCNDVKIEIVDIQSTCTNPNTYSVTVNVTGGTGPYTGTILVNGASVFADTLVAGLNTEVVTPAVSSGVVKVTVEDFAECTDTDIQFFAGVNYNPTISTTCVNSNGQVTVTSPGDTASNVSIAGGSTNIVASIPAGGTQQYTVPANGTTYTVLVTSANDPSCSAFELYTPDCCNPNPLKTAGVSYECSTGLQIFLPSGAPGNTTTTITGSPGATLNGTLATNGQILANGTYTFLISGGGCSVTRSLTIDCSPCEGEDTCDLQQLYISNRILSLTIGGVVENFPFNTQAVFCENGNPAVLGLTVQQFETALSNFLGSLSCSAPTVTITCPGIAPPSDPNDCYDGVPNASIALISIFDSTADVDGYTAGGSCFVPSVQDCGGE